MLDSLDSAAREVAVTSMLDQARQWLVRAKESTAPAQDVAQFKAFVATVAEAAKQKKLSEDIQLDAVEMVRRSERALGVAIREGQAAGQIARTGDIGGNLNDPRVSRGDNLARPRQFFGSQPERTDAFKMSDTVTEDEFEEVIATAKAEGNLSRANVVAKVSEITSYREQQDSKWEYIAEMAAQGLTSHQIAREVGMSEKGIRESARKRAITFPADKIVGRTRRVNPLEVLEQIVMTIEVSQSSLELVSYEDVTPEQASEWLQRLAEPLRAIRKMQTELKEIK
ncbi:hypothetical protein IT072_02625 [Leifsonia sp. ZF2019]|uniref:hypothetical protein n=1 Tax=Leifsonia sp. ZF2019 TaxID=2781978 RepID=UPI001CBCDB1B|nr:hypothetical protein [Leifsonia sp. ZF2019]UAJ79992.1 hypothetical protein IT072_02625 [Leifsonia sp. ZF2019]